MPLIPAGGRTYLEDFRDIPGRQLDSILEEFLQDLDVERKGTGESSRSKSLANFRVTLPLKLQGKCSFVKADYAAASNEAPE